MAIFLQTNVKLFLCINGCILIFKNPGIKGMMEISEKLAFSVKINFIQFL
jgi:hypothetical protein